MTARPSTGRWSPARAVLVAVDGMVAVTAVGGGVALASGLEAQNFTGDLQRASTPSGLFETRKILRRGTS